MGFDIGNFTIKEMTACGRALRNMGEGAGSMEEVAGRIVRYCYDSLIDGETGARACSLVRFYRTLAYRELDEGLRSFARQRLGDISPSPEMKCLVLLATAGEKPQWESRAESKGHRAIPLPSEQAVNQAPMISNLIRQLGISVGAIIRPDTKVILDAAQKTFNVFHVHDALGSPFIPAQDSFVIPYGIRSVVGFGGMLPAGDMFSVIIFFKVPVSRETANLFSPLSLNVKVAVIPFEKAAFA